MREITKPRKTRKMRARKTVAKNPKNNSLKQLTNRNKWFKIIAKGFTDVFLKVNHSGGAGRKWY